MNRNIMAGLLAVSFAPVAALAQEHSLLPVPSTGNVTLPLDEYTHLLELAGKPKVKLEAPPVPYAVNRADLHLRVNSECVSGSLSFEGEIFNKGETKVPLSSGLTILDAHQGGKALPLEQESGTNTAILPGPADFGVTLDVGMPLTIEAGRASFTVPAPSAGSVRLSLVVPGDHSNVQLSPGLITARASSNGQTTIEATLVPGQLTRVSWATREIVEPAVPREVRFLSDVKSLITVSEAELRIAVLADVTVVQGEPSQFEIELPPGYELAGTSGASVDSSEVQGHVLTIKVTGPTQRSHEFLLSLEKPINGTQIDAPFVSFKGTQRETGEVLVEGAGSIELTATEGGGLKRMDLKEVNPYLRSLAHFPLQAAFRYHVQPNESPKLALEWTRFPDSSVLAAVAERAEVTTLVTSEGRSLTEVKLTIKNQAQPFLKVDLPAGASVLSAEVAGEKVKPVEGPDGNRVPLLRAGFRPTDSYQVDFVFLHSGLPFAKKGGSELSLPKMDVPISVLNWEVFLPQQYKVKDFGGDVFSAVLLEPSFLESMGMASPSDIYQRRIGFGEGHGVGSGFGAGIGQGQLGGVAGGIFNSELSEALLPGQLGGYVVDPSGGVIANAHVSVVHAQTGTTLNAMSDSSGHWSVSNVPSGPVKVTVTSPAFRNWERDFNYDASQPLGFNSTLNVGSADEVVTVTASAPLLQTQTSQNSGGRKRGPKKVSPEEPPPSDNVLNLQRRVSGVLPVSIDVPRAGNSYRFVRPLVLDEETKVTFTYKSKG
jgi:Carboxypeptidase regulatory-like domain